MLVKRSNPLKSTGDYVQILTVILKPLRDCVVTSQAQVSVLYATRITRRRTSIWWVERYEPFLPILLHFLVILMHVFRHDGWSLLQYANSCNEDADCETCSIENLTIGHIARHLGRYNNIVSVLCALKRCSLCAKKGPLISRQLPGSKQSFQGR